MFDASIRAACLRSYRVENLPRITASPWVRHVWTLQEALLALELYYEFFEGELVSNTELRYEEVGRDALASLLAEENMEIEQKLGPFRPIFYLPLAHGIPGYYQRPSELPEAFTFEEAIGMLAHRISKPEDEPFTVAFLLGVNIVPLLEHSDLQLCSTHCSSSSPTSPPVF